MIQNQCTIPSGNCQRDGEETLQLSYKRLFTLAICRILENNFVHNDHKLSRLVLGDPAHPAGLARQLFVHRNHRHIHPCGSEKSPLRKSPVAAPAVKANVCVFLLPAAVAIRKNDPLANVLQTKKAPVRNEPGHEYQIQRSDRDVPGFR